MVMKDLMAWMIIPTFTPVVGGAQTQVQQISGELRERSWDVQVLTRRHCYAHPRGLPSFVIVHGVPVRRLYSRGGSKVGGIFYILNGLWHLARYGRGQIYHAHDTGAAGWMAVTARFLLGGRCLVKLRTGANAYERSLASRLTRWQFLTLLRLSDRVIVVNKDVQDYVESLGIPAHRVVCIPNGVDGRRYHPPNAVERIIAREKLGLSNGETAVLYVGRLEHLKGVDILLRAWRQTLRKLDFSARLIIVGDGPEREKLVELAQDLGITGSVVFAGEHPDVREFYWGADIFVLPSRTEGLSNALLEAMACGLPVIASRIGGAKDLVVEWENGFFFNPEAAGELSVRLSQLIPTRELQQVFGSCARRSALDYAGLDRIVQRLNMVYQQVWAEDNL